MAEIVRNGVLVMEDSELKYLGDFLNAGDRDGFYLAYYNMTGSEQAFEQAQVASFSENKGGVAYSVNALLQNSFPSAYQGIYYMSQNVALGAYNTIVASAHGEKSASLTGYLTDAEFFTTTLFGWAPTGVEKFPGNALIGPLRTYDPSIFPNPPEFSADAALFGADLARRILFGPHNPIDPVPLPQGKRFFLEMYEANPAFVDGIFNQFPQNVGQIAGSALAIFDASLLGKLPGDYVSRAGYSLFLTPDGRVQSAIADATGKMEASFDLAPGSSADRQLGRVAEGFSRIARAVWGLPDPSQTKDFRLSLTEDHAGFNGDINPNLTNSFSQSSPTWHLTAAATGGNDTLWNAPTGGSLSGGGGDDFIFGGTKRDVLSGDAGDDVLYGRGGSDELHGGDGADLLRGGDGGDVLYGEGGDDILDGGDFTPGTVSKDGIDRLYGGDGDDTLFGGFGADRLFGEQGDDTLRGGTGNDELDGGEGDDSYESFTGDGHDIISDSDGQGAIYYNDEQLTVAQRVFTNGGKPKWKSEDGRYVYTLTAGDIHSGATIEVSGDAFASGDGFSLLDVKIENQGDSFLGLDFDVQQKVALTPGKVENFFADSSSSPATAQGGQDDPQDTETTLGERLIKFFTVSLRQFLRPNEKVIIRGGGIHTVGIRGDDQVSFENGELQLNAVAGQSEITFGVYQDEDIDQDSSLNLTAEVVDENGDAVTSNTVTVNLDAMEENSRPQTNHDIFGDRGFVLEPTATGSRIKVDDSGNPVTSDEVIPDFNDFRFDSPDNDNIQLGGAFVPSYNSLEHGADYVRAERGGDDVIEQTGAGRLYAKAGPGNDWLIGGAGATSNGVSQDMLAGGEGNDTIFGETEISLQDAIQAGRSDAPSGNPFEGDVLSGNAGDDILIGGRDRDLLSGGGGKDTLVGGAGDDILLGDSDYTAADVLQLGYAGIGDGTVYWTIGGTEDDLSLTVFNVGSDAVNDPADSGADAIYAGNGDDIVFAGGGDDTVWADAGDDRVYGEGGADSIMGGDGDDTLVGDNLSTPISQQGADFIDGGAGDDRIFGGGDGDSLYGGAGDDQIFGDDLENPGDDYIDGEDGNDLLVGAGGNDTIYGGAGDDEIGGDASNIDSALHGDDYIDGEEGDDSIAGGGGSDTIYGGAGDDHIEGDGDGSDADHQGDDYLDGGDGEDTIIGGGGADTIFGGEGNDQLFGEGADDPAGTAGDDYIDGEAGNDLIVGGGGSDTLIGGEGDDQMFGESADPNEIQGDDYLDGGAGDDQLNGGGGADTILGGDGNDVIFGDAANTPDDAMGDDTIDGGAGDDIIAGAGGNDTIEGGDGNDQIDGDGANIDPSLHGNDTIDGGAGDDVLFGGGGDDSLEGGDGNDVLQGGDGNDTLDGGAGIDFLDGGEGDDILAGGDGEDIYSYDFFNGGVDHIQDTGSNTLFLHNVFEPFLQLHLGSLLLDLGTPSNGVHLDNFDPNNVAAGAGIDKFVFDDGTVLTFEQLLQRGIRFDTTPGDDFVQGTSLNDTIDALAGDDTVDGGDGNDTLSGGDGADVLLGGQGGDTIDGGAGSDVLLGEEGADHLSGGGGDDFIDGGDGNDSLNGGEGGDVLQGGDGNDTLDGGAGADTLAGGAGDDAYFTDGADALVENPDEGIDTVNSSASFTLGDNFENLTLTGNATDLVGTGNDEANEIRAASQGATLYGMGGDDHLIGSGGDDVLDGGAGTDKLEGGAGDDLYIVDSLDDEIVESDFNFLDFFNFNQESIVTEGHDTVQASFSYVLPRFVEDLVLTGTDNIDGGGNSEQNTLIGNDGDNTLTSEPLDNKYNNLKHYEFGGTAIFYINFDGAFPQPVDERLFDRLLRRYFEAEIGNVDLQNPSLTVDVGARDGDVLIGNGGNDRLIGGWDNDELYGGDGNDLLVGSGGSDYMEGGAGDDVYLVDQHFAYGFGYGNSAQASYVDDNTDEVVEYADEGNDTVYSKMESFELGDNFENLILFDDQDYDTLGLSRTDGLVSGFSFSSIATDGYGNDLDNHIRGNAFGNNLYGEGGNDRIDGGAGQDFIDGGEGADEMHGGQDSDTYVVDNVGDLVVEDFPFWGEDSVYSSISYTLTDGVEDLYLQGASFENLSGTGNELSNIIQGDGGDNVLTGLGGNDQISGGDGNDTLIGGDGNDTLDGGQGDDAMTGGAGNDTYYVDSEFDTTSEDFDQGIDNVLSWQNHQLGANIENLYLQGEDDLFGLGNELANEIIGNSGFNYLEGFEGDDHIAGGDGDDEIYGDEGDDRIEGNSGDDYIEGNDGNDVIDGGEGSDYMVGGAGDDTYYVDEGGLFFLADRTIEGFDEGFDQVFETVFSYRLEENVEKGTIIGEFADDPQFAELYGNDLDNTLIGSDGDNYIQDDQGGDDTIDGRAGHDEIHGGAGNDTIKGGLDATRIDTVFVRFEKGIGLVTANENDQGAHEAQLEILAANDDVIHGEQGNDVIDGGSGNDSLYGEEGDDTIYGGDDGLTGDSFVIDSGEGSEGGNETPIGERVFLTNDDYLDGGAGDDYLDGGSGNDQIYGGDGSDTLYGGDDGPLNTSNNDLLDGGAGIDVMRGGTGDDTYYVDGTFVDTADPAYDDCGDVVPGVFVRQWTTDTVIENPDEGHDVVYSAADFVMPANVEELHLLWFSDARSAYGSDDANSIYGNGDDNRLEGRGGDDYLFGDWGDDVLDGGAGNDVLEGDYGNDTYNLRVGSGQDTIISHSFMGSDSIHVLDDLTRDDISLSRAGTNLVVSLKATGDSMTVNGWFNDPGVQSIQFCEDDTLYYQDIFDIASGRYIDGQDDFGLVQEDGTQVATGNVLDNDFDSLGHALVLTSAGSLQGQYGTLELAADGSYTYTLNNDSVQWLSEGASTSDTFSYGLTDEEGLQGGASLSIEIDGQNDAPTIVDVQDGGVTEDAQATVSYSVDDSILQNGGFEYGYFGGWDLAGNQDFTAVRPYYVLDPGTFDGFYAAQFGAIGSPTFLSQDVDTFAGQHYLLTFQLTGNDAGHEELPTTFSASWNGAALTALDVTDNDWYTQYQYEVTADSDLSHLEFAFQNDPDYWYLDDVRLEPILDKQVVPNGIQSTQGEVHFRDVDWQDEHAVSISAQGQDYLGDFSAEVVNDSFGGGTGTANWYFDVSNDAIQYLAEGETLTQAYDVTVSDAFGGSDTRPVTVQIHGTNDAPEMLGGQTGGFVEEDFVQTADGALDFADVDLSDVHTASVHAQDASYLGTFSVLVENDSTGGNTGNVRWSFEVANADLDFLTQFDEIDQYYDVTVDDGHGGTATQTVQVSLFGANEAPVTVADAADVQEDVQSSAFGNVLANDYDVDAGYGGSLFVDDPDTYVGQYGTLYLFADGSYEYDLDNSLDSVQRLHAGETVSEDFSYLASDGYDDTPGTLTVRVTGTNDAPVAEADVGAVKEDVTLTTSGNVLDNDSDLDHDTLLRVARPGTYTGAYGKLNIAADGSYTYTLKNNQVNFLAEGELLYDTFSYTATDADPIDPLEADATLTIAIEGTNDAPKSAKDTNSVFEDGVLRALGNVLDNDTDVDEGTVLAVANPGMYSGFFGTLILNADGTYQYDLNNGSDMVQRLRDGQQVTDSFSYTATDGYVTSSNRLLITVNGANDAPSAFDDFADVIEDLAPIVTGNVLANDTDPDVGTLLKVAAPDTYLGAHGTLVLTEQGAYTYTLDNAAAQSLAAGETVTDVFSYAATDGIEESAAQLTVTITGTNDAPTAVADFGDVSEDGTLVATGNVLANDGDVDHGASVSAVIAATYVTAHGTLVLESNGDYAYTLDNASAAVQGLHGHEIVTDTFDYSANDGQTQTGSTLTIRIEGRNDTPVGMNDAALVREDAIFTASGNLLANDTDADAGTVLTISNPGTYTDPFASYGTLTVQENGDYSFVLDNAAAQSLGEGQTAHQYFIYTMSDGYVAPYPELPSDRGFALLDITIEGVNDVPVAVADFAAVVEDGPLTATGNVLANDTDADAGTVLALATAPGDYAGAYGTLTLQANGDYGYLLNNLGAQHLAAGESVFDSFTYTASDGITTSDGTLTVRISGANDAPVTVADADSVTEDIAASASGNVLGNDTDSDSGTVLAVANPGSQNGSFGTLSLASTGAYTYTLNNASNAVQSLGAGETRTDTFTYQASDGLAQTPGTLTVTINGTNDAPVVVADSVSITEDAAVLTVSANVLANDSDIDAGTVLTVVNTGTQAGTYGSLVLNQDGTYAYTLNNGATAVQSLREGQAATDVFNYTATDGFAPRSSTLTVNITGKNDAPVVANPIPDQNASAGNPFSFTFASNAFTDIDQGDVLSYSAKLADGSALPSWLTFNAATRTFTGTPPGTSGGGGGDCGCDDTGGGTPSTALQIRVTAADQLAATAFDDFALNIAGSTGGGGDGHGGQLIVGTAGNDVLTGTACDDVIDGREGYDKMSGGKGNDVYFVDQTCTDGSGHGNEGVGNGQDDPPPGHDTNQNDGPGTSPGNPGSKYGSSGGSSGGGSHDINCVVDLVVENADEGYDTVYASTDYVLPTNVEALYLTACDDYSGTGNALDNVIVGNSGNNTLNGAAGNDTLEGGQGNDTLTGGAGADTYVYSLGDGKDVIDEKGSAGQTDTLKLQGMAASSVQINKSGNDLIVDFPGRDGKVTIKNWFSSSASRVEQFKFDDGTTWNEATIRSRVGKYVAPVADTSFHNTGTEDLGNHSNGSQGSSGHDDGHHDDDHHGGDGDHHHEEDCRNDSDEAILKRLKTPAKFCFQDIMQAMGNTGPTLSAAEIARRWATARGYFCDDGNCDDHQGDASAFPSLKDLGLTVAANGRDCSGGFGYSGSTGGQHGGDPWFQCFNGLSDGFRKL